MMSSYRHFNVRTSDIRKESINKERVKRAEWKGLIGPQYEKAYARIDARDSVRRRDKIIKDQVPQNMAGKGLVLPAIRYPMKKETEVMRNQRQQREFDQLYGNAPYVNLLNMRPDIDLELRESIYEGLSHHGEGAAKYLDGRKRVIPEYKYKSPVVSSWEYGWHVGRQMPNYRGSAYAKGKIIETSFHRNTGVFNPTNESAGLSQVM